MQISHWIKSLPVFRPLRRLKARWRESRRHGTQLIRALASTHPDLQFVQIGSNDGRKHDPIHRTVMASPGWRGVMVEPVPYVFRRLQQNYASTPRIALENVAIDRSEGERAFYHLKEAPRAEASLPDWYDELGSFLKDVVLKHRDEIPDFDARLATMMVPCISFEQLCQRHALDQPGLLHLDTEGYDFEILKTVDFGRFRPLLVIYEHKHLNAENRQACMSMMQAHGYRCVEDRADTWCLDAGEPRDSRHAQLQRRCAHLFPTA